MSRVSQCTSEHGWVPHRDDDYSTDSSIHRRPEAALDCLAQVLILAIYAKYLAVTTPFVVVLVFFLQKFYLRTSRQLRLLDIEAKAPLFTQFIEITTGSASATIRAFGWQQYFEQLVGASLDRSQRPVYVLYCVQQWLALILDLIVSALAVILVAIVVNWKSSFDAGAVGVALVMVMTFNRTLMSVVKYWTMLETSVGAVSRIKQLEETTEPEQGSDPGESQPLMNEWPVGGAVAFSNLVASHRYAVILLGWKVGCVLFKISSFSPCTHYQVRKHSRSHRHQPVHSGRIQGCRLWTVRQWQDVSHPIHSADDLHETRHGDH
jgi:ABC-type multidrug transport system fused ATPase/permease subunit